MRVRAPERFGNTLARRFDSPVRFRASTPSLKGRELWKAGTKELARSLDELNRTGFNISNPGWIRQVDKPEYVGVFALVAPSLSRDSNKICYYLDPEVRQQFLQLRKAEANESLVHLASQALEKWTGNSSQSQQIFRTHYDCETLPYDFDRNSLSVHSFLTGFAFYERTRDPDQIASLFKEEFSRFHYQLYPRDLFDRLANGLVGFINANSALAQRGRLPVQVRHEPYGSYTLAFGVMDQEIPSVAKVERLTNKGLQTVLVVNPLIFPYYEHYEELLHAERKGCLERGIPLPSMTMSIRFDPGDYHRNPELHPLWFVIHLSLDRTSASDEAEKAAAISAMRDRFFS